MVIYYRLILVVLTQLFHKAHRWQLTDRTFTIEELGPEVDIKLFKSIVGNPADLLYELLPAHRPTQYSLRKRGHPFLLPTLSTTYFRTTFINRLLFQSV